MKNGLSPRVMPARSERMVRSSDRVDQEDHRVNEPLLRA
jgi:hypothetical protein